MQASLCHRTTSLNVKNHRFQHPVRQAIHRDRQLPLNFSPLIGNGLRAGPSRTIINPAIRVHLNPPDDDINKSEEEYESSDQKRPETRQEKSIQALLEIFDGKRTQKPARTPKKLLDILQQELLKDVQDELKEELDQLKTIERTEQAINSLLSKWRKMQYHSDQYNLGLVLIDLLIYQGDYEKADTVCKEIESNALPSDVQPQIRRAIINLMLLVGETEKTARILKAETLVLELLELIRGTKSLGPPKPNE